MKFLERLGDVLSTPGLGRWRLLSLALLAPVALGIWLNDWLQGPDAAAPPLVLALGGLFFLSQALLLLAEGGLRQRPAVLLTLLLFAAGLFWLAVGQVH